MPPPCPQFGSPESRCSREVTISTALILGGKDMEPRRSLPTPELETFLWGETCCGSEVVLSTDLDLPDGDWHLASLSTPTLEIAFSSGIQMVLERVVLHSHPSTMGGDGIVLTRQHILPTRLPPLKNHVGCRKRLSTQNSFPEGPILPFPETSTHRG